MIAGIGQMKMGALPTAAFGNEEKTQNALEQFPQILNGLLLGMAGRQNGEKNTRTDLKSQKEETQQTDAQETAGDGLPNAAICFGAQAFLAGNIVLSGQDSASQGISAETNSIPAETSSAPAETNSISAGTADLQSGVNAVTQLSAGNVQWKEISHENSGTLQETAMKSDADSGNSAAETISAKSAAVSISSGKTVKNAPDFNGILQTMSGDNFSQKEIPKPVVQTAPEKDVVLAGQAAAPLSAADINENFCVAPIQVDSIKKDGLGTAVLSGKAFPSGSSAKADGGNVFVMDFGKTVKDAPVFDGLSQTMSGDTFSQKGIPEPAVQTAVENGTAPTGQTAVPSSTVGTGENIYTVSTQTSVAADSVNTKNTGPEMKTDGCSYGKGADVSKTAAGPVSSPQSLDSAVQPVQDRLPIVDAQVKLQASGKDAKTAVSNSEVSAENGQDQSHKLFSEETGQAASVVSFNTFSQVKAANVQQDTIPQVAAQSPYLQVVDQIVQAGKEGRSDFKMRLNPEGLGQVSVIMSCQQGKISLKILTSVPETGKLLEGQMDQLKAALTTKNYELIGMDVHVAGSDSRQASFSSGLPMGSFGAQSGFSGGFRQGDGMFGERSKRSFSWENSASQSTFSSRKKAPALIGRLNYVT